MARGVAILATLPMFLTSPLPSYFHHATQHTVSGRPTTLVSLSSPGGAPAPLCLAPPLPHQRSLDLLAHMVCAQAGAATFTSHSFLPSSQVAGGTQRAHTVACSTEVEGSISCLATPAALPCSSLVSLTCGACSFTVSMGWNSNRSLTSPLYPTLPAGLPCTWHLDLQGGALVTVEDVGLAGAQSQEWGRCGTPRLLLEGGGVPLAVFCGEGAGQSVVVPGGWLTVRLGEGALWGSRGFKLQISVAARPVQSQGGVLPAMVGAVGLMSVLGAMFLVSAVLVRRARASRPPRARSSMQGVRWRGPAPRRGALSTAQLARANSRVGPNFYAMGRHPMLQDMLEELEAGEQMESTRIDDGEEKIYESLGEGEVWGSDMTTPPPTPPPRPRWTLPGAVVGETEEGPVGEVVRSPDYLSILCSAGEVRLRDARRRRRDRLSTWVEGRT